MANPHANLTVFSCPQLAPASPDVVRSFFRRFHTLERVTLRENFSTGNEIHTLPGTSSLAIMVGLNSLPALRELSLCVDANGITQTLLLLNTLRTLNSLALHVEESQTNEESDANEESIVEGLQAFCCCSPTLETLLLDLSFFVSFDLTVMEFVPSLQHLDLTRVRIPAPTRSETGACAVRNRSLRTLSLTKCRLGGNDYSFVYHLEGLAKLELNEMISETSNAYWGDRLRRMPSLRALRIESWLGVNDGAVLSSIAESIHDNSTFESLELKWRTAPTSLLLNTSMGPLMHRLRHTLCLDRMRWSVSNVTFISNALACRSDLQHLYLGFRGTQAIPFDEWYEPLFRALRCCRRLESVQLEQEGNTCGPRFTSLQRGNEFREWLGSSNTIQSLTMHGYSFNRCFLANAGSGVLRSTSLASINFRSTKVDDLTGFGQALVQGPTLQRLQISREALSDEFLLQLARMPLLKTLGIDGMLDNHLCLLVSSGGGRTEQRDTGTD